MVVSIAIEPQGGCALQTVNVGEVTKVGAFSTSIDESIFLVEVGESVLWRQGCSSSSDDIKGSGEERDLERLTPDITSLKFVV